MPTFSNIALTALPASYRDRMGFVFTKDGVVYRYISSGYQPHYQFLKQSGLFNKLVGENYLIAHEEIEQTMDGGMVIKPEQIAFVSYPYEWSFDMWKDAALLTLKIMSISLQYGMVLKDATPFNITFYKGRPVFIDTLSFEKYEEGKPWVAYRQFCECFLSPLLLMYYNHRDCSKLFLAWPDGIPLEIAKNLLPSKAKWNWQVFVHIWLQSKIAQSTASTEKHGKDSKFSKKKLEIIIEGLASLVNNLKAKLFQSTWNNYYSETILSEFYLEQKRLVFQTLINEISFNSVLDLGANDGYFSLLAGEKSNEVLAVDIDSNCVNDLYNHCKANGLENITTIVADLTNPAPAIGWDCAERASLPERLRADLVLGLALVHHLAIGKNVPLKKIAQTFSRFGKMLIIEFVPKTDEKVKLLLQNREDIFNDYNIDEFRNIFSEEYTIIKELPIKGSERTLFLMQVK